jgi:hypothetical protein
MYALSLPNGMGDLPFPAPKKNLKKFPNIPYFGRLSAYHDFKRIGNRTSTKFAE